MRDYKKFFKGKKITVMGLGLLGRGVGDAAFLAECGAKLTITDLKTKAQLAPSLKKLKKYKNIKYTLGKHRLEDFRNADFILKAAGVPLDSIYIKEAKKYKIPVEMSATIFTKLSGLPIVAVTGTRGKSTVTHLIEHILKKSGKKVLVGGNIRGLSNLALLKKVKNAEIAVLEMDSWQLQGFGDKKIAPHIAIFTTFFPDHMSYYGGSMKKYFLDKANIFKYQGPHDILIIGAQVKPFIKKWGSSYKGKLVISKEQLPLSWKIAIPGEHNLYNAALAAEAARRIGVKNTVIKKALESFKGIPGRLEFVREIQGVRYYNDTNATTPEATLAALHALGKNRNIVLIAGGFDKGLNTDSLIKAIPKYCKSVVLLAGTGTKRIKSKIKNNKETYSMKSAVLKAKALATKGDLVLLSPAFASFGLFENEYDRGDQFVKLVRSL